MARTKAVALFLSGLVALAVLAGITVLAGLTLAQTEPPQPTTQVAGDAPPADAPPPDEAPPEQPSPPQPAPADTTTVTTVLAKSEQGQLTAEEQTSLVKALDGLISSSLQTTELLDLTQRAAKTLGPEEKAQIRVNLLDRLAGTAEKAGKLAVPEARQATIVFDVLNGPAEKGKLAVAWMGACETWQTAGPEPLVRFLTALTAAKPDEAAKSRAALVDHVWTTYLSPQADAAKATGPEYAELAIQIHRFLSPERAKELSAFIIARLSEPKASAQLSIGDIKKVRQTLGNLHNQLDVAHIIAAWVNLPRPAPSPSEAEAPATAPAPSPLAVLAPADIGLLCDQLRPKEGLPGPRVALAALAETARARKLLSDPQAIVANDAAQWPAMARALRNYITEAERLAVVDLVKPLYLDEQARTGKLTAAQLADLADMCGYYRSPDLAGQVAGVWLAANDLAKLSADQLALVGAALEKGKPADVAVNKGNLGDLVWSACLSRQEYLSKATLEELTGLVKNVAGVLSPERKAAAAEALLGRFGGDTGEASVLPTLSVADAIRLAEALAALGKRQDAGDLVLRWMAPGETWTQAGLYEQKVLAGVLRAANTQESVGKAQELATSHCKQQLAEAKPGQPLALATLAGLADFLEQMDMVGKGKAHPEYAAALAAALKAPAPVQGTPDYRVLALPLGTADDIKLVEPALANEDGSVRLDAAKVMAWAYKHQETLPDWQKSLDARLAELPADGDVKAMWLLARAYAIGPGTYRYVSYPVEQTLRQAITVANSESAKLLAMKDLIQGPISWEDYPGAYAVLAEAEKTLTTDESVKALAAVRQKVQLDEAVSLPGRILKWRQRAAAALAKAADEAGRPYLRDNFKRLAAEYRAKETAMTQRAAALKIAMP